MAQHALQQRLVDLDVECSRLGLRDVFKPLFLQRPMQSSNGDWVVRDATVFCATFRKTVTTLIDLINEEQDETRAYDIYDTVLDLQFSCRALVDQIYPGCVSIKQNFLSVD